jgi:hypothetical protein
MSNATATGNIDRVRADQERRRSGAAGKHKNVRALDRKGQGKGGRSAWKRSI